MLPFRVYMTFRVRGALAERGLDQRIAEFTDAVAAARREAAATATAKSAAAVKRVRPFNERRTAAYSPIEDNIRWASGQAGDQDLVRLDTKTLDQKSRHWLIQNIGTGRSAVIHQAGRPNPQGRPAKDSTYVRSVPSQRGRRISSGLVFATGPTGTYTPPGQGRNQQLYLRSKVKGVPSTRTRSQPGIIIQREIKPQRFVQAGAKEGFREYRRSVLAAARTAFDKPR